MTADDFAAWRKHVGVTGAEASRQLGLAPNTITAYEKGRAKIPLHVALACMAIACNLPPWPATVREDKPPQP